MALPRLGREQGQSVVIVAVMLVALVGSLALVVDIGAAYAQRRTMQNAADAGALAGARALALLQDPYPAVTRYAQTLNGADVAQTTVLTPTITVTASKDCRTYFASILGVPAYTVRATAEATYSSPSSWSGADLVPVAVYEGMVKKCPDHKTLIWDSSTTADGPKDPEDYPIGWEQAKDNLVSGPNRGWLDLNNNGSLSDAELKAWIQYGYTESTISVGDTLQGDPGSRSSALQTMSEYRIGAGKIIICPLYDSVEYISGNQAYYHISGFAAFTVEKIQWQGYFKYMLGCFINYVSPEDQEGGQEYNSGLRVVELKR